MKNKNLLQNAIILPLVVGLVLSAVLFFYLNANSNRFLPLPQDIRLAYHDDINSKNEKPNIDALVANDCVGEVKLGKQAFNLYYNADYSMLAGGVSITEGSTPLNEIGCSYIKTTNANAEFFKKEKNLKISGLYGEMEYELVESDVVDNEYAVLQLSPRASKSLIIYYQNSNNVGLTSKCNVLIYKEVK